MIYLSQRLSTVDGKYHALAGVLPFAMEMTGKLVQFGYVTVELTEECLLGAAGTVVRGHSFHYSRIVDKPGMATNYRVQYSLSDQQEDEGYRLGNILASYIHLHFRAAPELAQHFVEAARNVKTMELASA